MLSFEDIQALQTLSLEPDHRIPYGEHESQFGELFLPGAHTERPTIVLVHGGCWKADYGIDHVRAFAGSLRQQGFTVWALEYRRLGEADAGWPGTFQDIATATDLLRELARTHPIRLDRVVSVGHSAGGQIALWLASRGRLRSGIGEPVQLQAAVSLAGVNDLERAQREQVCEDSVTRLLGNASEAAELLSSVSPFHSLPMGVRQVLIHGREDAIVPCNYSEAYVEAASAAGDSAELHIVDHAGHFELIAPSGPCWETLIRCLKSL